MELNSGQGAAIAKLDECIADVGYAFDNFVKAADACEAVHVPGDILQAKALQLQGEIARRMMAGLAHNESGIEQSAGNVTVVAPPIPIEH